MKFSRFISIFFHPINFPIIGTLLYFLFIPRFIFKVQEHTILIVIIIGTYIFPLLLLFLMKQFKMIESYHMETVEERKFPLIMFISIAFIIANWLFKATTVDLLALFYTGYGIGLILAYLLLFLNHKISLHAAAIGGLLGFTLFFSYTYQINLMVFLGLFFILGGVIGTARIKLKAHTLKEVLLGFSLGVITQFLASGIYHII